MTNAVRTAVLAISKTQLGPLAEYGYTFTASDDADHAAETRIRVPLNTHVIENLCSVVQQASEAPDDHTHQLRSIGRTFYRLLFNQSDETKSLARRLAGWRDPLIISSDEVEIPWELLHDGEEFLGIRLAVGRRYVADHLVGAGRPVGEIRRALIVSNPTNDLPAAADEAARLAAFLAARGIECMHLSGAAANWADVSGELGEGGHDIFHYSGHVGLDEMQRPALRLHDQYLANKDLGAMTAANAPPIVFINGCRSASHMSSVCSAFLKTGSRIVMGTRYPVDDVAARDFSEQWYGSLLTGMAAGAALSYCRSAQRDGPTGTWAAFVLFGLPTTQLWDGPPPPPPPPPPEKVESPPGRFWAEHASWLEPGVSQLIRRVTDAARSLGIVTTFHLAEGLLDEETPLSNAIDSSNIERETVVETLLLFTKPGAVAVEPSEDDGETRLSDNVRQIFEHAIANARAERRAHISVNDVANSFILTGGGHAGEVLTLLEVKLPTDGSLFDASGCLNAAFVAPETQRAIRSARFLSSTTGEVISSYSLLLGCALASSPVFREALLDQGPRGEMVVQSLFPEGLPLSARHFSRRAHVALEQARRDGNGTIDDAHLLEHVLSDPSGTASGLIQGWGLDPRRLRDSIRAAIQRQTEDPR